MEEAERIAREEHGSVKIAVISGEFFHRDGIRAAHFTYLITRGRNSRLLPSFGI